MPYEADYETISPSGSELHWAVPNNGLEALILSSSQFRAHASIFNHSNATLHLRFGSSASLPNGFDVKLTSGSYYEMPKPIYTGPVYGAWDAAGGFALVLELGKAGL